MSKLAFSRNGHTIRLLNSNGEEVASWEAYNNVDSHYQPWPDGGPYGFVTVNPHSDSAGPDSAYGSYGIIIFSVAQRRGMGVHSGRKTTPDGLGRSGPQHATHGCIRTTDTAVKAILDYHLSDPLTDISVAEQLAVANRLAVPKRRRRRASATRKGRTLGKGRQRRKGLGKKGKPAPGMVPARSKKKTKLGSAARKR